MYPIYFADGRIQADAFDANASVRKKLSMHSSDRFSLQIMRNNTFCENTTLIRHKFQQSYFFLEMSTKHIPQFTSEIVVLSKTCPSTITLTFPPLIYTAMFQNLLFKNIKNEFHIHFLKFIEVYMCYILEYLRFCRLYHMFRKCSISLNVLMQSQLCRTIL